MKKFSPKAMAVSLAAVTALSAIPVAAAVTNQGVNLKRAPWNNSANEIVAQQEDNERHKDEVDDGGNEGTILEHADAGFLKLFEGGVAYCNGGGGNDLSGDIGTALEYFFDNGGGHDLILGNEGDEQVREIKSAEQPADKRHDKVVDNGIDDALERSADDNGDGEIHNVTFQGKLLKLL